LTSACERIVVIGFGRPPRGIMSSEFEKQAAVDTPLGRVGQPDDVARIAVFLASDASGWLTGERLQASGGWR
jgi:3-oxoacyl-[acyl-carrier protein] reductase